MKTIAKMIALLLLGAMVFTFHAASYGTGASTGIQKTDAEPPLESHAAVDRILIMLDTEESLRFKDYTANDFSEIDCVRVTELTSDLKAVLKQSMDGKENGGELEKVSFNTILCLEIKRPGKENVSEAISILKKKEHVVYACPDYSVSISSIFNAQ